MKVKDFPPQSGMAVVDKYTQGSERQEREGAEQRTPASVSKAAQP